MANTKPFPSRSEKYWWWWWWWWWWSGHLETDSSLGCSQQKGGGKDAIGKTRSGFSFGVSTLKPNHNTATAPDDDNNKKQKQQQPSTAKEQQKEQQQQPSTIARRWRLVGWTNMCSMSFVFAGWWEGNPPMDEQFCSESPWLNPWKTQGKVDKTQRYSLKVREVPKIMIPYICLQTHATTLVTTVIVHISHCSWKLQRAKHHILHFATVFFDSCRNLLVGDLDAPPTVFVLDGFHCNSFAWDLFAKLT